MLKVLHIVESLEVGGLEKLVVDLTKWQLSAGYRVDILSLSNKNPLYEHCVKNMNVRFYILPKTKGFDINLIMKIVRLIKTNQYQIVHTHNAMANYYTFLYKIFPLISSKLINTRHGMGASNFNIKKEKIFKFSTFFTDKIIFVTSMAFVSFVRQKLVDPSKAGVIINGVLPHSGYKEKINKQDLFPGLRSDHLILGTVARLNSVKNQKYLIDIFKELKTKCSDKDIRLVIVGDGPERNNLEEHVKQNDLIPYVRFTGMTNSVAAYLDIMDGFILTSKSEGIPLTIIEAMQFGKIIFSTSVGGVAEVISDRENGILIPLDNPSKAAIIIQEVIKNKPLINKLKTKALEDFSLKYNMDVMAKKYEQTYLELLKSK